MLKSISAENTLDKPFISVAIIACSIDIVLAATFAG